MIWAGLTALTGATLIRARDDGERATSMLIMMLRIGRLGGSLDTRFCARRRKSVCIAGCQPPSPDTSRDDRLIAIPSERGTTVQFKTPGVSIEEIATLPPSIIIGCALTGGHDVGPNFNAHLEYPITPQQIAADAVRAARRGDRPHP